MFNYQECFQPTREQLIAGYKKQIDRGGFQEETGSSTWGESGRGATTAGCYWSVEPAVGRVAHGVPHRVDRLRCLGNAVVPPQVYPILAAIAQIEKTTNNGL